MPARGDDAGRLVLENEHLRLELDAASGAVVQVTALHPRLELIHGTPAPAWSLLLLDGTVLERTASFASERGADGLALRWESERGDVVRASVSLAEGEPNARFEVSVEPAEGSPVDAVEYPVLGGVGPLAGDGEDDRLLHSYATGFVFANPTALFAADGDDRARGLLHSPYPEGFSGSTLQLMAYYALGRGGFYLAAEDATGAQKWLDFYGEGGHCRARFVHGSAYLGSPLAPPYPVVVGALTEGTWWEAADRYKAWAVEQPWCARPREADRRLREEIGLATFGINASQDRSRWLAAMHELAGTPVLHVLGPNWAKERQDYEGHLPGGIEDWFPARFHPANLDAIRATGDRFAPFLFDLLFGRDGSDGAEGSAALQEIPTPARSLDAYAFPFLCPATQFVATLHAERDERLTAEADAVYYDISANNVIKRCHAEGHDHPPGGGAALVDAYRRLFAAPEALRGTELVNEVFGDLLGFYQARAEASPASAFEADRFRDWIKSGRAEKVPLHAYVYHEHGPVRMDGWAKLSREQGDLFYWIGARVLAWGGLFQLNYEFSPLETLDGEQEPLDEHYFPLPDHRYEIDLDKAAFVRELAAARVGPANPYLAYGTMLPPLPLECPSVELDWFHYNCPPGWPAYEDRGTQTVPAVVHCGWRHGEGAAVVLVNVDRVPHVVEVPASAELLRLDGDRRYRVSRLTGGARVELGALGEAESVPLELPSRRVVVLEVTPGR